MSRSRLFVTVYSFALGLFGLGALLYFTRWPALVENALPLAFFALFSFILKRAGFHVAPDVTHSLVGIVDLAALYIFGPALGAWVAVTSGFTYLFLNALRHEQHTWRELLATPLHFYQGLFELPLFNAGLKVLMAFVSGEIYLRLGGTITPRALTLNEILPLATSSLAWFVFDHLGWGVLEFLRGGLNGLAQFLRRIMFYSLMIELAPLPFAMLIAVVYTAPGGLVFGFLALAVVGTAIVVQRFGDTSVRLQRRTDELTALNEFGQALARAGLESERVLDLLLEYARRIGRGEMYRIELDEGHDSARVYVEARGDEITHPNRAGPLSPALAYLRTVRTPRLYADLAHEPPPFKIEAEIRAGVQARCALFVPLIAQEELLGALMAFCSKPHGLAPIQLRNLSAMVNQAAVALQNARLYAVERRRAAQLATVSEVSRQVAQFLDLDVLLSQIVTRIRERFGYAHVHIFIRDESKNVMVFRASTHPRGAEWQARGVGYRIGSEGIVGWVAATGEPLTVNDVSQDPRFVPYPEKVPDETRSEIVVPLVVSQQVIGVLDVEGNTVDAFGPEDLFVLNTLAAQIAVAIEDARLFNAQREEAWYLNVLLQVAENLSAITDLDEALEAVVRITPLLVGVARCALFLYDPREQAFLSAKAYGLPREMSEAFKQVRFPMTSSPVFAEMWEKKEPVMIENVETSERVSTVIRETFGIRSMLLTPLMAHGEIVGSLVVDQGARPRTFTPHEISVVMGIANQAAVAIENARLNQEAEGKKRLEYELSVARQIQESFLPAACPVVPGYEICSAWRTAREVSGDFYDFVSFGPEKLALMIADVSDKGMPAALFMVLARTILRTMVIGKPTLREALERANDIIIADAPSDMFVTTFYALLDADHHHLTYVNAGHNPPFLYRHREGELTALKAHGMALAVFPNIRLEEQHVELEPGDALLLYTDGVTEAIDAQEKEFGAERLGDLFAANAHRPVQEIVDAIVDAVTTFTGDNTPFDDVTLMVVKRKE